MFVRNVFALTAIWLVSSTLLVGCGDSDSPDDYDSLTDSSPETAGTEDAGTSDADSDPEAGLALQPEKSELKFGFIKLTDCAPLVIAKEKGFFEDEGLQVELIAQPNWKQLLDNVINGELDGAHMLSGQPLAATIGFGTKAHIVTAFTMDLNGNGITVSNGIWEQMVENDAASTHRPPCTPSRRTL